MGLNHIHSNITLFSFSSFSLSKNDKMLLPKLPELITTVMQDSSTKTNEQKCLKVLKRLSFQNCVIMNAIGHEWKAVTQSCLE